MKMEVFDAALADPSAYRRAKAAPRSSMIGLFLRLYLTIILPVIVIVIIVGWSTSRLLLTPNFRDGVRVSTANRFAWVRGQLDAVPVDEWKSRIDATRYLYPTGLSLDEETAFFKGAHPDESEMRRFQRGEVAFATASPPADPTALVSLNGGTMTYSFQKVPNTSLVMSSQFSFANPAYVSATLYELLFAVVAAAPILLFWFRAFRRDLERINGVTEQIGAGNFSVQAAPVRAAAVKPFATAIDQMSVRIGELVEAQKNLTNSVAHELVTPIAFLVFSLALLDESELPDDARRLVRGMAGGLGELESLVAELMENARLEYSTPFQRGSVDVRELLEQSIESARRAPNARNVAALEIALDPSLTRVDCDAHQMHRAIVNLLRNALRYSRSRVVLSADQHDGRTAVHVDDDGPGIPVAERSRLYEPFARMDASRTRETGGHGLGLAIVRRVAKLHGGDSWIETSALGGARVSIEW